MKTGENFEDEVNKLRGNVITVMGIPNDKSPQAVMKLVNEISELAINSMHDVEVAHMTDIPVITAGVVKKYADEDDDEVMATPAGRAAASIYHGYMESIDLDGEKAEQARYDALSEEEKADEKRRIHEAMDERSKESRDREVHQMQDQAANAFDVAEKWSKTPDLSSREVAHGVAHDLHTHYAADFNKLWGKVDPTAVTNYPTPSKVYQNHYDGQFTSEIKNRSIRAAHALFGKKG